MYIVELLLVGVSTYGPNYVRLIEAVSYSSTYVSLVYGADSINLYDGKLADQCLKLLQQVT